MPAHPSPTTRRALLLIPFATLLVLHPLFLHGPSCGQDLAFHLQSWLDAAAQLRHGHYPHWDITAAWNAGEPRFLFYPPISWLLGALLTLLFPINLCPTLFIAIALLLSGLTFYKLASTFSTPNAALVASTLYLANPYMLFCAFERSALAELLAAAWIPLLLLAFLRKRPTIHGIAIPLALLWLTNAPAAVIGTYTAALLATLRVLIALVPPPKPSSRPERSAVERPLYFAHPATAAQAPTRSSKPAAPATIRYPEASASGLIPPQKEGGLSPGGMPLRLALTYLAGTALGLTLPAFYLLPAAYERKFVQVSMALLPGLRYQDNFLFTHTSDAAHNAVNHTISLLALTLLLLTALALITLFITRKPSVILSQARSAQPEDPEALHAAQTANPFPPTNPNRTYLPTTLALLTALIAFLLTPLSAPVWHYLPNLAYLQFPWRLLTLLSPTLALAIALLLDTPALLGAPFLTRPHRGIGGVTTTLALLLPLALAVPAYLLFHQPPDPTDNPTHLAQLFRTHHGFPPTDEYTPTPADNDPLRSNNPAFWLLPANANPNTPAPNTTPTAAELNPNLDTDDTPIPDTQTLSTPAPHHLTLTLTQPSLLVLNLRAYPNWDVTAVGPDTISIKHYPQPHRDDGLIALHLPRGQRTLTITWHRTPDQTLGLILSALSAIALALTSLATKKRNGSSHPNPRPS